MKRIIALFIVVALCSGLLGCANKHSTSNYNNYANGGVQDEAREKLESQVKQRAWGGGNNYNAKEVEVTFSSFKLIADYKWEGKGTVQIKDRGYTAQFNAWIYYATDRRAFSWSVELSDVQYN